MLISEGNADYPIQLRGAPCGLGLGDRHWRDRYGVAWGARVREHETAGWKAGSDPEWWVDVVDCRVYDTEDNGPPPIGDWYLLPEDLQGAFVNDVLVEDYEVEAFSECEAEERRDWVDAALDARREYEIPNDLLLRPTGHGNRQRSVSLETDDAESKIDDLTEEYGIPKPLRAWLETTPGKRAKLIEAVETIDEMEDVRGAKGLAKELSYSRSTLANYWSKADGLDATWEQDGKFVQLTPVGKQAAAMDWESINERLEEIEN
jgi:hypothetical protein